MFSEDGGSQDRNWRQLEKQRDEAIKERDEALTTIGELQGFQRRTMFARAGFPVNEQGDLFGVGELAAEAYKGELTVDAIRKFATERLIPMDGTAPPPAPPDPEATLAAAVAAAQGRTDQLGARATPAPAPPSDNLTAAEQRVRAYEAASGGGPTTPEEIAAITAMQQAHIAERRARGVS
ncbi:MAG: hypothetical protein ABIJ75_05930 [Actinomycetota bacterium]